jgi:hypothetical protein
MDGWQTRDNLASFLRALLSTGGQPTFANPGMKHQ